MSDISTPRLSLLPFPHTLMMAVSKGNDYFTALSGLATAPDWPNPDLLDAMSYIASTIEAEPKLANWTRLFVLKASGLVIGEAGFKGLPDADGAVEIGYGIAQSYRRIGLATEAVRAMCAWAWQQPGVRHIRAECLPENIGSIGTLRRAGFVQTASDPDMLHWELQSSMSEKNQAV